MVVSENKQFNAISDFNENVYSRYLVIMLTYARSISLVFFILSLFIDYLIFINPQEFIDRAYKNSVYSIHRYLALLGFYLMPLFSIVLLACLLIFSNEKIYSKKYFEKKSKYIRSFKDEPSCASIHFRTMHRYCASLEVYGKRMIIEDKVIGLINGDLDLNEVGKNIGNEIVEFNLNVDQIVAMWISRDVIILRFCWGETYRRAWDVIIKRSNFISCKDKEFIHFVLKNIRYRRLTYDYEEFVRNKGVLRIANESTNLSSPVGHQHRVKIYHNFWGPFKKRKKQEKDEEQSNKEEAK